MTVSINLLTYNGRKYIKDCLLSVFSQTYPDINFLIIDNGSTDGTREFLSEVKKEFPEIRLVLNDENIGFAGGHNQAIEQTGGDFVLCLNQDVVLDKNFVKNAVEVMQKNKKIAAIQGKLLRPPASPTAKPLRAGQNDKNIIDTTGLVILKNRRIINREQGRPQQNKYKIEEIFGADGAAPVFRRKALDDIAITVRNRKEYFDEHFFCYKEDVDLAWRLRLNGWKAVFVPEAVAWHDRTAGENAALNYLGIIKERRKINSLAKYFAFKNQRLMQIKNESLGLLIKHFPQFLPKEILSWIYVIIFEKYSWQAIRDLFRQAPLAWQKRKRIMANKKVNIEKWFQ